TTGVEHTPYKPQSLTMPEGSLSWTACQRNSPFDSRKHIRMPLSMGITLPVSLFLTVYFGSRGLWLLVPTKILPSAITGPPCELVPSWATHLILSFFSTSHSMGTFLSQVLTMLR